jgi:hypothetical protein
MIRKGLAFGAGLSLVATGLAAMPAQAAAGDLTLRPTTGTGFTVFNTDTLSVTVSQNPFLSADETDLGYYISNPDQHTLLLDFNITENTNETINITGIRADGSTVAEATTLNITDAAGDTGDFVVDFANTANNFVAIAITGISDLATASQAYSLEVSVLADEDETADLSGAKSAATAAGLTRLGFDDGGAKITLQAWLETSAATLVDAAFATASETLEFIDPASVSVISRVERVADAVGSTQVDYAVKAHLSGNQTIGTSSLDAGDNTGLASGTYSAGDLILLTGQTTQTQDGLYLVNADGVAPSRVGTLAGLNGLKIAVGATSNDDAGNILTVTADADGATETSAAPANETFTSLNAVGQSYLTGSLRFNKVVNLDQIDLTKWEYALQSSEVADVVATSAIDLRSSIERLGVATTGTNEDVASMEIVTPAGYLSTNKSAYGKLLFRGAVTGDALAATATYNFQFMHTASATAPQYKSPSFQVVQAPTSDADKVFVAANSAANTKLETYANGAYPLSARAGVGALTYTAQITDDTGDDAVEDANVPVMAIITAGPNWAAGETISVTGTSETISRANQTLIVTSLTDSDGQWEFTVTSTDSTSAKATYEVDVYMLDGNNWTNGEDDEATRNNTATLNVDYATAGATAITTPSNVVASSSVSLTFTIEDAFGEAIAKDALDRQYSVQLTSPDTDDIDLDVVATDGTATFTFDNYLTAGESEILTARVYRGTATSPILVGVDTNVTLFALTNVSGINVSEEIVDVVVSYADFITGKTSAAAPGPTGGTTYSGTVVDANGAGIPGAVVTIAADGFQFKSGDLFSKDSVTLASTTAGTFSVTFWTHIASATGVDITVTSGDKVETTTVKSVVPTGNASTSTKNLSFSWNIPATLVMNTTYAITAKVTDKWGNGISGANVDFNGYGAAQFNGLATTERSTNRNGEVTVFLRSLKDVDGPSAIGAELVGIGGATTAFINTEGLAAVYTDAATTEWDESKWTSVLEADVNFLATAPAASADAKVNAGSFNGYVAVYAKGYKGQTLSWKIAGQWFKTTITEDYQVFQRTTAAVGVNVTVELYINGQRPAALVKQVLTR